MIQKNTVFDKNNWTHAADGEIFYWGSPSTCASQACCAWGFFLLKLDQAANSRISSRATPTPQSTYTVAWNTEDEEREGEQTGYALLLLHPPSSGNWHRTHLCSARHTRRPLCCSFPAAAVLEKAAGAAQTPALPPSSASCPQTL